MSTGEEILVIKADEKQDAHTAGGEGWQGQDGHVMELIVDAEIISETVIYTGDCDCLIEGTVEGYAVI